MATETTVQTTTPTHKNHNGQVYTCSVKGCGKQGPAYMMSHVQPYGQPSVDSDGNVRNVVCGSCGKDAAEYGGDGMQVHPLVGTLNILAANKRRRAEDAAADERARLARIAEVSAFCKALGAPEEGTDPALGRQAATKARRIAEQAARDAKREQWDQSGDRAANGHNRNGVLV